MSITLSTNDFFLEREPFLDFNLHKFSSVCFLSSEQKTPLYYGIESRFFLQNFQESA